MINKGLFTSDSAEWATPQDFFDKLNEEFHFTLDPCATAENAKCNKFYTKEQDGLAQDWTGEVVFCNPPYGRNIGLWCEKCYKHSHWGGYCCDVGALPHGYTLVSRLGVWQGRIAIRKGAAAFQRQQRQRAVSVTCGGVQRNRKGD